MLKTPEVLEEKKKVFFIIHAAFYFSPSFLFLLSL